MKKQILIVLVFLLAGSLSYTQTGPSNELIDTNLTVDESKQLLKSNRFHLNLKMTKIL